MIRKSLSASSRNLSATSRTGLPDQDSGRGGYQAIPVTPNRNNQIRSHAAREPPCLAECATDTTDRFVDLLIAYRSYGVVPAYQCPVEIVAGSGCISIVGFADEDEEYAKITWFEL